MYDFILYLVVVVVVVVVRANKFIELLCVLLCVAFLKSVIQSEMFLLCFCSACCCLLLLLLTLFVFVGYVRTQGEEEENFLFISWDVIRTDSGVQCTVDYRAGQGWVEDVVDCVLFRPSPPPPPQFGYGWRERELLLLFQLCVCVCLL